MNRRNSKKSTPPKKKNPKKSSTASQKTSTATLKSTPVKTRSSRLLPKSPISESMKQSKINDFFKPMSPSIRLSQTEGSSQPTQTNIEVIKTVQRKAKKGPKLLEPIFGPQKRYSLRKSNESNSAKKLKSDINEELNQCSDNPLNSCATHLFVEVIGSDNSHNSVAEVLPKAPQIKRVANCGQNLDQMMDGLKINENQKSSTIVTNILKSSDENHSSDDRRPHISDTNVNKLCEKLVNNLDEDMDLIPVFKVPEVPKLKKSSKENTNKYVDKEKEKKMSYFLNNLSRIRKDKEMLNIQTIEEMEIEISKEKCEETDDRTKPSDFRFKPFEGIDIFSDYISKTIEKYLFEEINKYSSRESIIFSELPLNRLLSSLPLLSRRIKESECQQLVSHIIHSVSTEENQIICTKSEYKLIEFLSENDFEFYLSLILKDFYRILSRISMNLRNSNDSEPNDCFIKKELKFLSNVIRVISQILSKSSFKIEAIDSVEELIKLLIISFGLGLDKRLIKNGDQIIDIKNLIAVILNNIFVDELKAIPIVESLISFCTTEEKSDVMIALQIASLFPLSVDFELKRKFCISVIQLFIEKNCTEFEVNLNEIINIFNQIDWKSLSPEDIYIIIQMIGISLDLPKDLIDYKQTIASILGVLDNKINSSLQKASEFEFSEIPKLLMILRTKVNVSTKRNFI